MRPFWHPLSAVYLTDPPLLASPAMIRMALLASREAEILYGGDRMWPAIAHLERLRVRPAELAKVRAGDVVLAAPGGIPDVLRVRRREEGALLLGGDADPLGDVEVPESAILARVERAGGAWRSRWRAVRRMLLDLIEAATRGADPATDPDETVRVKYDGQAAFYRNVEAEDLDPRLLERVRTAVPVGRPILVAGSGTGRECFALEAAGYPVVGVDFAPAMVLAAKEEAARRGSAVEFIQADLRELSRPAGSAAAVVFTYDVYSFVSEASARVRLLQKIARWLTPSGVLFLSARRLHRSWERVILTVQFLVGASSTRCWGASHTRYLEASGALRRSFVQVFSARRLGRETRRGGFVGGTWVGGHGEYRPARAAGGRGSEVPE